jgi:heme exporter protein D
MLDLDAGKYAMFVWPAYGVSAVAFIGMIAMSLGFSRRWRKRAEELKAPERTDLERKGGE